MESPHRTITLKCLQAIWAFVRGSIFVWQMLVENVGRKFILFYFHMALSKMDG